MKTNILKYKYRDIKEAYTEVKAFLGMASSEDISRLNLKIVDDLKICGDDTYFLLIEFIEKYDLNFVDFEYNEYFDEEGFVGFKVLFGMFLRLPFRLINFILIQIFSNNSYNKIDDFLRRNHYKKDLTFGDLVLCKLRGEFSLRKEFRIELILR